MEQEKPHAPVAKKDPAQPRPQLSQPRHAIRRGRRRLPPCPQRANQQPMGGHQESQCAHLVPSATAKTRRTSSSRTTRSSIPSYVPRSATTPPPPPPPRLATPCPGAAPKKRARDEAIPAGASSGWLDDDDDAAFAACDLDAATASGTAGGATPPASSSSTRRPGASPSAARASAPPPPPTSGSGVVGGGNGAGAAAARSPPLAPYTTEIQRGGWAVQLKETFLTPFRDDLFDLYAVARREQPAAPLTAFTSAGITLLAPFKLLAGEVAPHDASCLDDRGVHDPPEFQPLVLVTEGANGAAALGYWRDDPADPPAALVVRRANPPKAGPGVTILALDETHLVHALAELVRKAGASAPLRAQACARVADTLGRAAAADGLPPSAHASGVKAGSAAAARKKASIGPTSNRMGIMVPYDRQSEVGYRTLV